MRKRYSKEFKEKAIKLLSKEGATAQQISKDLGITPSMLYKWRNASIAKSNPQRNQFEAELKKTTRRIKLLEMENEILKKCSGLLGEGLKARVGFIYQHRTQYPLKILCQLLNVSKSTYFASIHHKESKRKQENRIIVAQMKEIAVKQRQRFGRKRMMHELRKSNIFISEGRVYRLQKKENIFPDPKGKV